MQLVIETCWIIWNAVSHRMAMILPTQLFLFQNGPADQSAPPSLASNAFSLHYIALAVQPLCRPTAGLAIASDFVLTPYL